MFSVVRFLFLCVVLLALAGCASSRPKNIDNICEIFESKPQWYKAAKKSAKKWGGPIHLPMAIIYQESSFRAKARPEMKYILGVIPKGRASNAYGYSQALTGTWGEYEKDIGARYRERDNFANSYDFVQWYMNKTYQRNKVSKWDAYAQYLNYHEGHGGYARGTYKNKQWLIDVAKRVDARSKQFSTQLSQCAARLDKKRKGWF